MTHSNFRRKPDDNVEETGQEFGEHPSVVYDPQTRHALENHLGNLWDVTSKGTGTSKLNPSGVKRWWGVGGELQ